MKDPCRGDLIHGTETPERDGRRRLELGAVGAEPQEPSFRPSAKLWVSQRCGKEARPPETGTVRGTARGARRNVSHVSQVHRKVPSAYSSSEGSEGPSEGIRGGNKMDKGSRYRDGGGCAVAETGGSALTSHDFTGCLGEAQQEEEEEQLLLRDLEELRSENEYLKDEMEELRLEMLELQDAFLEEDEGQLRELRVQLEGTVRACRVLKYRLQKAERRRLCMARSGQVDMELICTLEQDVKVARDVSLRLHAELTLVEEQRTHLERENQELCEKLLDLEVTNQVLREEADKARQNSLRKRGTQSSTKLDRKSTQDDVADLRCQLHFAKEELLLMCKKLTKTAKESEGMREELAKYRSLYGDVDVPLTAQVSASHPYAYNPETKVHLRLLEEEANLLSRRIIELEVENSGLQAEMEELKEQEAGPRLGPGVDSMKELKRHLQFMEEEADLLRCSLVELEEQNRALKRSLGQFRTELESGEASQEDLAEGGTLWRIQHGSLPSHTDNNHPPFDGPAGSTQELLAGQGMKAQRNCTSLKRKDRDTQLAETEETDIQMLTERLWLHDSKTLQLRQDAQLLVLRLHCFLKQWHEGKARDPDLKVGLQDTQGPEERQHRGLESAEEEEPASKGGDPYLSPAGKESSPVRRNCKQASQELGSALQDLKGALQELSNALQGEWQASLEPKQQFSQSMPTREVERSEVRRVATQLDPRDTEAKYVEEALQKGCEQHTCPMVADPCIAIRDLAQGHCIQEKVQPWDQLCQEETPTQVKLDAQSLQNKTDRSSLETGHETNSERRNSALSLQSKTEAEDPTGHQSKAEDSRNKQDTKRHSLFGRVDLDLLSGKNWMYLTEEAESLKGNKPFKTWDCPTWTSTFPDLDLSHGWVPRSRTAPDKSGLRIYYSPPQTRRIAPQRRRGSGKEGDETTGKSSQRKSASSTTESRDGVDPLAITFESWLFQLSEQQRNLVENRPVNMTLGTSLSLPFQHLEMSGNLSDDMKEITYGMYQVVRPSPLDRRLCDAASQTSEEDHGDSKIPGPLLVSVGMQTEGLSSGLGTQSRKSWPPRVSSLTAARVQQISVSLERVPHCGERSRFGSRKLHRHLACSSSTSRLDKERLDIWGLSQRDVSAPTLAHSGSTHGSLSGPSSSGAEQVRTTNSKTGSKASSTHKYGIVQEFFRNVCGRGHTPNPRVRQESRKTMPSLWGDRKDLVEKKTERPASRPASLARSNSFSKIVNKRLMNQNPRDERGGASWAPRTAERTMTGSNIEEVACDCTSRSLTSCFSRSSRSISHHHTIGHCKPCPPEPSLSSVPAEKVKPTQK